MQENAIIVNEHGIGTAKNDPKCKDIEISTFVFQNTIFYMFYGSSD